MAQASLSIPTVAITIVAIAAPVPVPVTVVVVTATPVEGEATSHQQNISQGSAKPMAQATPGLVLPSQLVQQMPSTGVPFKSHLHCTYLHTAALKVVGC